MVVNICDILKSSTSLHRYFAWAKGQWKRKEHLPQQKLHKYDLSICLEINSDTILQKA